MNEDDLRDCFAMFALVGLVMREGVGESMELDAWAIADKMLEARKPKEDGGITTVVKRTRKTK